MHQKKKKINRRESLKIIGAGSLGGAFLGAGMSCQGKVDSSDTPQPAFHPSYNKSDKIATVSLVKGKNRREIVYQSLKNLEKEILESIGKKKVLIKPNLVYHQSPTCATDPDAIRGVLDFLSPNIKDQIIVGESTASRPFTTMELFEDYGYFPLQEEYDIKLVDLNKESYQYRHILGENNTVAPVRIISWFLDPDIYLISVPRMKTHAQCYVTLSLKNVLMAAPLNDYLNPDGGWTQGDKYNMHVTEESSATDPLYYNLYQLAHHVYPDLAVIDGFEGMEGDGPVGGPMVDSRIAVTSLDALAADVMATKAMDLDPGIVPYLNFINEAGFGQGDPEKIQTVGTPLDECICKFEPSSIAALLS
ncbi:DUF362 domain-containing protein [Bacteroidota bacterium]